MSRGSVASWACTLYCACEVPAVLFMHALLTVSSQTCSGLRLHLSLCCCCFFRPQLCLRRSFSEVIEFCRFIYFCVKINRVYESSEWTSRKWKPKFSLTFTSTAILFTYSGRNMKLPFLPPHFWSGNVKMLIRCLSHGRVLLRRWCYVHYSGWASHEIIKGANKPRKKQLSLVKQCIIYEELCR